MVAPYYPARSRRNSRAGGGVAFLNLRSARVHLLHPGAGRIRAQQSARSGIWPLSEPLRLDVDRRGNHPVDLGRDRELNADAIQAAHLGAAISRMLAAQAVSPCLQIAILSGALALIEKKEAREPNGG